jgi:hypothetical protein
MYDIFHEWGSDLVVGSGGDLALATGSVVVSQRVCRRLLTNPGDYIWNLNYGGGLASNQLLLETAVPTTPAPQVTTAVVSKTNGSVVANITYADPISEQLVTLNVSTG